MPVATPTERLAVVGGVEASVLAELGALDVADAGPWLVPMPQRRQGHAAVAHGGDVLVFGGRGGLSVATRSAASFRAGVGWRDLAPMIEEREFCGCAEANGCIWVVAGRRNRSYLSSVEVYERGTWALAAPLFSERAIFGCCTALGAIVVCGGLGSDRQTLDLVELFEPDAGHWCPKSAMPAPLMGCACCAIGAKVFVVGGWGVPCHSGVRTPQAAFFCYDVEADAWSELAAMPTARGGLTATTSGHRFVWAIGGAVSPTSWTGLPTVERFDTLTGVWQRMPELPLGVVYHATVETTVGDF